MGSLDAGFNLPLILAESPARSLRDGVSFEAVLAAFEADARVETREALERLNARSRARRGAGRSRCVRGAR